jgi:hypothetical protein
VRAGAHWGVGIINEVCGAHGKRKTPVMSRGSMTGCDACNFCPSALKGNGHIVRNSDVAKVIVCQSCTGLVDAQEKSSLFFNFFHAPHFPSLSAIEA